MPAEEIPNPEYSFGVDKAGYELIKKVRPRARSEGFVIGDLMHDQHRGYIYPITAKGQVLYLFFGRLEGGLWYAHREFDQGIRCMRDLFTYDKEEKVLSAAAEGQSEADAFLAGLSQVFDEAAQRAAS